MGSKKKNKTKTKQAQKNKNKRNTSPNQRKTRVKEAKRERKEKKKKIEIVFQEEMKKLGYYIKEMQGDGNCLFRSFADQYENNQNNYNVFREKVIQYMTDNLEEFKPYIEDDETIDQYLDKMAKDGEWGGNLEIHALSKIYNVNFYIHIHEHPMYIVNNNTQPIKNIMLTYQEGKHYNSLRKLEDKINDSEDEIEEMIAKVEHLNI